MMETSNAEVNIPDTPEAKLRASYYSLFHEMQFRCTKNALMNYHQAEVYEQKGDIYKRVTTVFTAASATGVLASIVQKGQMLASKMGVAGLIVLPICGAMQLVGSSTSEFVPSYYERARRHTCAAAGWMQVAETARTMQLWMKIDSTYDLQKVSIEYEQMLNRKESISKEVRIPRDTHKQFHGNTETVYLAMAKRHNTYMEFLNLEAKNKSSIAQIDKGDDTYF
uniref:SMODS and SLOG-associating 2TM effector domain-containing protein n=1 Tax=Arion vulgaris TaxID=1028688 RepID=A0A0B6YRF7_9EUPU